MNVSRRWLEDFLRRPLEVRDLAERLTMLGAPVDAVEPLHGDLSDVLVAEVEEVRPHPNADRLRVCVVNGGNAERVHVPALADHPESGPEDPRQQAPVVQEVLEGLLVVGAAGRDLPEHPVDVDQDDEVDDPDDEQEDRRDARPDQPADLRNAGMSLTKPAESAISDRQGDDDRRVAEREEEPDADRPLAVLHQLAGGVVDGRDVVGVDGVAEPEGVGEEGRRQQDRVLDRRDQREEPTRRR